MSSLRGPHMGHRGSRLGACLPLVTMLNEHEHMVSNPRMKEAVGHVQCVSAATAVEPTRYNSLQVKIMRKAETPCFLTHSSRGFRV
jgi:hypothetical protein